MNKNNVYNPIPPRYRLFSGSALKLFAVVTMLIDHTGAGILYPYLMNRTALFFLTREQSILLYRVFRGIGRTAFPIYCFLLVEGFFYTRNRLKYLLRMLVFTLLSEIPFDLALIPGNEASHTLHVADALRSNFNVYIMNQNVFWTLSVGLAVIWLIDTSFRYAVRRTADQAHLRLPLNLAAALVSFLAVLSGCYGADLLHTDYGSTGVVLIVVFYLLYRIRPLALAAGYGYFTLMMPNEIWSFPGILMMLFYNGKRGLIRGAAWKYFFYAFYPVHLMCIYVIRTFIL